MPALVEAKLLFVLKPWLPAPAPPRIPLIATREPDVEKLEVRLTPWLVAPEPAMQLEKITFEEVLVVQGLVMARPCEELPEEALIPPSVMIPVVLTIPLVVAIKMPGLVPEPPVTLPVKVMGPLVVVRVPPFR